MLHKIIECECLPGVAPDSQLGRAYGRMRDLAIEVQQRQLHRAGLASELNALVSAFRLAHYTGKEQLAREIAAQTEMLNQQIEASDRELTPLRSDLRCAEEDFAGLERAYQQSRAAIDALRSLAG